MLMGASGTRRPRVADRLLLLLLSLRKILSFAKERDTQLTFLQYF